MPEQLIMPRKQASNKDAVSGMRPSREEEEKGEGAARAVDTEARRKWPIRNESSIPFRFSFKVGLGEVGFLDF
jgi:hypothetical protein